MYVARDASRVYTRDEIDGLRDLKERSDSKSGTSGGKRKEIIANGVNGIGKELSLQASRGKAARHSVLKVLNTSRQHVEIGKNVKLGTAEHIPQCTPRVTGFDFRNFEAGGTSKYL